MSDYGFLKRLFRDLFSREGYEFDYIFDWTILKYQQAQRTKPQPRLSPISRGTSARATPMIDLDKQGAGNTPRGEVERVGPSAVARPTLRVHFKGANDKNLVSDSQRLDKLRVGTGAEKVQMPSTSFVVPSFSKKNIIGSNQSGAADASQVARGSGDNFGSSSSWLPTFQWNTSAK